MTFLLKMLLAVTILLSLISTSGLIFAQSYDNNSNTTSQSKPPIATKSPVLSDSEQRAIINAAMNVPGLKTWSSQWQYLGMDFIGTINSTIIWQYAVVHLRLPVNASAPFHCVFPYDATIKVDIATKKVVESHYPTLQNFNCNLIGTGPIGYVGSTNNTIIKNTTAYDIYKANNGFNSTVPEFPIALVPLAIAFVSLLAFYRIKF